MIRTEVLTGWGMANFCESRTYHPRNPYEVAEAMADANGRGLTVAHRGAGLSYGDAALNHAGAVVLTGALDQIVHFDAEAGVVRAQAGVTIRDLWHRVVGSGWWPPVVPGSMQATIGGCVAMNVHGKNNARAGCIGEHVIALTFLEAQGNIVELTAENDGERMRTVIGAQGLNGTILDVTLRLKRVHSGFLEVRPIPARSLEEGLEELDRAAESNDYAVGWLDAFSSGRALGRGLVHAASHLPPDHALAARGTDVQSQQLPERILGVLPRAWTWRVVRPLTNNVGMRAINALKYIGGRGRTRPHFQTHAAFHFLLDYVPNWKFVYRPGGLIQYQFFIPRLAAPYVFRQAIELQQRAGIPSFLAVLKRHRRDHFAASYSVDGFSLALDFPVKRGTERQLAALCIEFDAMQAETGGHIYAAKDSVSRGQLPEVRHPLFSSNLARRWETPLER